MEATKPCTERFAIRPKDYREPEKPRFPHGCFRGRRGVIRLWDEASDEGRGGKCQHREQDVAAGNDGVLVGEPESKGKEEAQDERKRRPAQQHENADGSECAGDPVHADVADVEAGRPTRAARATIPAFLHSEWRAA